MIFYHLYGINFFLLIINMLTDTTSDSIHIIRENTLPNFQGIYHNLLIRTFTMFTTIREFQFNCDHFQAIYKDKIFIGISKNRQ